MARVTGPAIDPAASYTAVELMGKGMFRLIREMDQSALESFMTIKISRDAARRIGRHKLAGETLAQAVERLAIASLPGKQAVG